MSELKEKKSFFSQRSQKTLVGDADSEAHPTHEIKEPVPPLPIPPATTDIGLDAERAASIDNDTFEVHWDGGDTDPANPRSLSYARKWLILSIVSVSALCV